MERTAISPERRCKRAGIVQMAVGDGGTRAAVFKPEGVETGVGDFAVDEVDAAAVFDFRPAAAGGGGLGRKRRHSACWQWR